MSNSFTLTRSLKGFEIFIFLASSFGMAPQMAYAGCNPFGCSRSSVAECNPFGCPNPPLGEQCTPFGCPPSPQPASPPPQNNSTSPSTVIVVPANGGQSSYGNSGGSGRAIADCMKQLLYDRYGYRTQISEDTAIRACQNAR
jgi:hypothetical protein